jgi:membrane-associated protease RseP (regulator of RpoE activity)
MLFNTKNFEIADVVDMERKDRHMSYFVNPEPAKVQAPDMEVPPVTLNAGQVAGMQEGDIILELNGENIYTAFKVFIETMYAFPGDIAVIKVLRDKEEIELELIYQETDFVALKKLIDERNNMQRGGR